MKTKTLLAGAALTLAGCTSAVQTPQRTDSAPAEAPDTPDAEGDSVPGDSTAAPDKTLAEAIAEARAAAAAAAEELTIRPADPDRLTYQDYCDVARRLKVEPEAVMAVVEIEAGRGHEGFYAPGKPIINFDLNMFKRFSSRHGIELDGYRGSHPDVFRKTEGYSQANEYKRLDQAMEIDRRTAVYGTFWGMFQIGGFNWKLCGAKSYEDFVERMSRSERDQLDMFANLILACDFDRHLRDKDWTAFARNYNGPGYRTHGYHKRIAGAYERLVAARQTAANG